MLAATDQLGHRHLYWRQGDGWAAMGTSGLALAYLASAGLDQEALAVYGQLGFHLGCATPFTGVHKLGPGGLCAPAAGAVRLGQYACPGLPPPQPHSPHARAPHAQAPHAQAPHAQAPQALANLARSTAGLLRDVGRDYLDEHPDLVLQLSGGLDSRIQLAAIPPARRAGIRAVTLEECGSPDSVIARQLALRDGLDHEMVALDGLGRLGPAELGSLLHPGFVAQARACPPEGKRGSRSGSGLADPGWLSELLAGTGPADVATVGFLVNLQVITETLGARRAPARWRSRSVPCHDVTQCDAAVPADRRRGRAHRPAGPLADPGRVDRGVRGDCGGGAHRLSPPRPGGRGHRPGRLPVRVGGQPARRGVPVRLPVPAGQ